MSTRAELALTVLGAAQRVLAANLEDVTLEEALSSAGGHRSIGPRYASWTTILACTRATGTDIVHALALPSALRSAPTRLRGQFAVAVV
jgi:hypothetical protein